MPEITNLPNAGTLTGDEIIPIVQAGETRQAPLSPYRVYTALLTQSGTDAPVATVLENTLGAISYIYGSNGDYQITSANLFVEDKTFMLIQNMVGFVALQWIADSVLTLATFDITAVQGDNILNKTSIEIRVYP